MSALTTFHLFPTLPLEIRLLIWSFNLSIPRTVTISCQKEYIGSSRRREVKSWATDTPFPPLLLVNWEARHIALTVYAPYFTTPSSPYPIYLSFLQDTVKFADNVLPNIPSTPLLEIQKMVLQTKDFAYFGVYNVELLHKMKKLRELDIYTDKLAAREWSDGDRYFKLLTGDFEYTKENDPGWECPMVRIFDGDTEKQVRIIEGGAKIPGWEPPKENPYVFDQGDQMLDGGI